MRFVLPACVVLAFASALSGQSRGPGGQGGFVHGGTRSHGLGFGNIVFPGGVSPIPAPAPSFGQRLGATIRGNPYGAGSGYGRGRTGAIVPYPVFVGGFGYGYGYAYPQEPAVTVVQAPPDPQSAPPTVIVNNYYTPDAAKPLMRDYTSTPPEEAPGPEGLTIYRAPAHERPAPAKEQPATLYLIAFRDGSIFPALGYWIEGDTLHYITTQGTHNKASLSLIDKELSERLNRERRVEFDLGKAGR